eukprot:1152030-Pelagomonas_calceolata.AAC.5
MEQSLMIMRTKIDADHQNGQDLRLHAHCTPPVWFIAAGRWPSDPQAFKKMKAALGLQLAEALEKSYGLITQLRERMGLWIQRQAGSPCCPRCLSWRDAAGS